ncbi:four helix bundle protein [Candidatus Uhrbacteria bacterium]|nr:four helix bundle protein [Candidatus Uhrbacteria bacterium]
MNITRFEDLEIWQMSLENTKVIYDLSAKEKFSKDFGLRDQIRRAVISISSNIVEGFEKRNNNEFCRFLRSARGSIGEVRNQLHIALSVGHISQSEFDGTNNTLELLAKRVGALISYLEEQKRQKLVTRNSSLKN